MELTVGSLFAGIGGFDLGFERAGMRTLWFCEQDPYCQRVLARHWPGVPCHPDVRSLVADAPRNGEVRRQTAARTLGQRAWTSRESLGAWRELPVSVPYVDVLCGGFPCQDISLAGKGAGIEGSRSGLWREFARLIGELRPRYVVVENVPALASRGLDRVLADLAACGFDAEWDHLPASAFGAPHRRDRLWLVAYAHRGRRNKRSGSAHAARNLKQSPNGCLAGERHWLSEPDVRGVVDGLSTGLDGLDASQGLGADSDSQTPTTGQMRALWQRIAAVPPSFGRRSDQQLVGELADALSRLPHPVALGTRQAAMATTSVYVRRLREACEAFGAVRDASESLVEAWLALSAEGQEWVVLAVEGGQWATEWPDMERVAHGVPNRVDRLRALGNSLVPQIAQWIGERIVSYES